MSSPASPAPDGRRWWSLLNRYHWFVLIVASLGWLFDCLDQQLFNLARRPAITELLSRPGAPASAGDVDFYSGLATCIFLAGWATGGLVFGVIGDRYGRARTMMITILIYSICTGLSALSVGFWDFAFYRFITGLGVGGEFAVGVAIVAEVMPERARPHALGLLQALSAVGNFGAALIGITLGQVTALTESGLIAGWAAWRWKFVIGALPALLALVIRARMKEPEKWRQMRQAGGPLQAQLGSYRALFGDPRWRRNAVGGMLLASAGVIGLWGIGFFSIDLISSVLRKTFVARGLAGRDLAAALTTWSGVTSMMLQVGALCGMLLVSRIVQRFGRRPFFAVAFVMAGLSTAMVFWFLREQSQIFWMMPIMGFFQLSIFAGYAIYFPELFPTHLRSTGTSFCYNVGRFVAASGPFLLGWLAKAVFGDTAEPMRYAGLSLCVVFLLGLLVLPFLPETKDQPLPEDERGPAH